MISFRQFRPSYDHFDGKSESLAVKTTYLTHYVSYLNLEGEVSRYKISGFIGNLSSN